LKQATSALLLFFVGKTTLLLRAPSLLLLFRRASGEIATSSLPSFLPWTLFSATRLPGQCFSLAVEDDDDDDEVREVRVRFNTVSLSLVCRF
jgi:hypothetical protein